LLRVVPLTVGSLFAGIGGFDLGLERAGMKVIWQSEIDPYASAVLRKHWPHVPNHGDIRTIRAGNVERPDVLCGGFPCQPFSSANAGRARGKDDDRYLWPEMLRVIQEVQPTWVIGENVAHLDRLALETVCSDLEACGYQVQTLEIPACAVDADSVRARLWILCHANSESEPWVRVDAETPRRAPPVSANSDREPTEWFAIARGEYENWPDFPRVDGVAHGLPNRMDRLRCIGNAIVPQIAEIIGRAIVSATP
jgi:DNA (cytosine-5)-methyltransferase 1